MSFLKYLNEMTPEEIEKYSTPEQKTASKAYDMEMENLKRGIIGDIEGPINKFVILAKVIDFARKNKGRPMSAGISGFADPLLDAAAELLNIDSSEEGEYQGEY